MRKNWKTTAIGIVGLAVSLGAIWAPPEFQARIIATGVAITSSGLLAAKDGDN